MIRNELELLGIDAKVYWRNGGLWVEFKSQDDYNLYMMVGLFRECYDVEFRVRS